MVFFKDDNAVTFLCQLFIEKILSSHLPIIQTMLKGNVNLSAYSNKNKQSWVRLGEFKVIKRNFCKEQVCTKHSTNSKSGKFSLGTASLWVLCAVLGLKIFKTRARSLNVSRKQQSWWKGWKWCERRLRVCVVWSKRGWGVTSLLSAAS